MSDHTESEVWLDPVSRSHCYVRLGKEACIATVNFPADSPEAEVVREALQTYKDKVRACMAEESAASANAGHFSGEK